MRTSNPALREDTFTSLRASGNAAPMTIGGAVNKTMLLLLLAIGTAAFSWNAGAISGLLSICGLLGGLIVCLILCFKPAWAPVLAPAYAILEGLFLGAVSHRFQAMYDGIVV